MLSNLCRRMSWVKVLVNCLKDLMSILLLLLQLHRGVRPVPPEKGIFPLDHMHECDLEKKDYINCLKSSGHKSEQCRLFSKKYLECRMEKNLMAKQDMAELGFAKECEVENSEEKNDKQIDN